MRPLPAVDLERLDLPDLLVRLETLDRLAVLVRLEVLVPVENPDQTELTARARLDREVWLLLEEEEEVFFFSYFFITSILCRINSQDHLSAIKSTTVTYCIPTGYSAAAAPAPAPAPAPAASYSSGGGGGGGGTVISLLVDFATYSL